MVGFWPWRGESSSTASFEKTLSTLSSKITETQSRLEKLRASSRRARVLWTLYLSFAYLVYAIVLFLVVGYKNFGAYEWTGFVGGPVLIYVTRTVLTTYYNFRIESQSARLKEHQEERTKTIQKLKDATKYDSTMELIEKYGGEGKGKGKKGAQDAPPTPQQKKGNNQAVNAGGPRRTNILPPATANIPRQQAGSTNSPTPIPQTPNPLEPSAEFAPNADFIPPPFTNPSNPPHTPQLQLLAPETHWYDRIFDVLLGEDETAPKNRIVLLCQSCRLINGQAPPGTKTLSEVGPWKCMSCGAMNGEMDEGKRIVSEVLSAQVARGDVDEVEDDDGSSDAVEVCKEEIVGEMADGPAAGVRKRRGKK